MASIDNKVLGGPLEGISVWDDVGKLAQQEKANWRPWI